MAGRSADPQDLVLWEAQFGDFVNGAQVIIDQFIAAGEAKWLRASGLVLLLPHAYEGRGPSIARPGPERFLQLCADDNIRSPTARLRPIISTSCAPDEPRFPQAAGDHDSEVAAPAQEGGVEPRRLHRREPFPANPVRSQSAADGDVRRLILCTGKLSYELIEERDKAGDSNVSIIRIEQLYPFPGEAFLERLKRMTNVEEVVWAQEEPKNQGYWTHVEPRIERRLREAGLKPKRPIYAGRDASASPATGLAKRHAVEQAAVIAQALGRDEAPDAQRKAG
jgi:2-oxoglutarate dehydrogenase E1 component